MAVETVESLVAENAALTKALTGLTCGGSEFFVRKGDRYVADIDACVAWVRRRDSNAHERWRSVATDLQDAKARIAAAEASNAEHDELLGLLARVRVMFRLDLAPMLVFGRSYNQAVKDVHDAVEAALSPLEASVSVALKGE